MMCSKNHYDSAFVKYKFPGTRKSNCIGTVGALLVWILVLPFTDVISLAADECEDGVKILGEVEACIDPLNLLNNISAVGSLSREQWSWTCSAYFKSIQCLQEVHQKCNTRDSLDLDTDLQGSLKAGLGELCVDVNSFVVYQSHEECFLTQTAGVRLCKETFFRELGGLLDPMAEVSREESKERICTRYDSFQTCIVETLAGPCGTHAAQLYCGLFKAQIPVHILSMCNIKPIQLRKTDDTHMSRGALTTPSLTLASLLSLVYLLDNTL